MIWYTHNIFGTEGFRIVDLMCITNDGIPEQWQKISKCLMKCDPKNLNKKFYLKTFKCRMQTMKKLQSINHCNKQSM